MSYEDALEQQVDLWATWRGYGGYIGRAASALQQAETYWLGREVDELVWAGFSSVPETVMLTPSRLPSASGFVWLDRPVRVVVNDGDQGFLRAVQWSEAAISVAPGASLRPGVSCLSYVQVYDTSKPVPAYFSSWIYGETVGETVEREIRAAGWTGAEGGVTHTLTEDDRKMVASQLLLLATFWLFVSQKILVAPSLSPARHARKRIERAGWQPTPLVRLVQLRRRETQQQATVDRSPHDWSCQWVVRGHWRQQFYPTKQAHQPRWITPYVKGPDDKPLKPPRATVFAVVR